MIIAGTDTGLNMRTSPNTRMGLNVRTSLYTRTNMNTAVNSMNMRTDTGIAMGMPME
jgi:hypothetical protein